MKRFCEICKKEFKDLEIDREDYCDECLESCKEQVDILNSEEARYFGIPYKLQIWTDEFTKNNYGEVEVTVANYSTICFKCPKDNHTIPFDREEFIKEFSFKRTVY